MTDKYKEQQPLDKFVGFLGEMADKIVQLESSVEILEEKIDELENKHGAGTVTFHVKNSNDSVTLDDFRDISEKIFEGIKNSRKEFTFKTDNQKRKELIEEAKRLTKEVTENREHYFGEKFYFYVNSEKRAVTCLIKERSNLLDIDFLTSKGIARCHPSDVFNEDIGKYVAMCRATGHKIPEKFLDPVQPDKLEKGAKVTYEDAPYLGGVVIGFDYYNNSGEVAVYDSDGVNQRDPRKLLSFSTPGVRFDDTNAEY